MKRLIIFLIIITFLLTFSSCEVTSASPKVCVSVLDIGKADCNLIELDHFVAVIDAGEEENATEILSYLRQRGIQSIDLLILSHFDKDHIGGVSSLLEQFPVAQIYESDFSSDRMEYEKYHQMAMEKNIPLEKIDQTITISGDGYRFDLYPPLRDHYQTKEDNNASLLVGLHADGASFLFCGDAMEERIEEFSTQCRDTFDVVKLPYHGRKINNLDLLLSQVKPRYGVFCCSKKNPADAQMIELVKEQNIQLYQTVFGTVRITYQNGDYSVIQ